MNKKSYMIHYMLTLQIFGAPKKLHFWQNRKKVLNQLNSARGAKLHKGHVQGLCAEGMQVAQSDLYLRIGEFVIVQTL